MGLMNTLRSLFGDTFRAIQRVSSATYGSAYAPPPIEAPVPEELRRAVDEERARKAKRKKH